MNTKHILATLLLSAGVISSLQAADAPARDQQDADKAVVLAEAKSIPVTSASVSGAADKTREQVIGELVEAVKNGSYVAPSELYPADATGKAQR